MRVVVSVLIWLLLPLRYSSAQVADSSQQVPKDWFLLDPESDHVQGISVEKAYATLLKGQQARTIVVAIIDTGIDINHEDLKSVIWTNGNEIPGNGIDDDKNGYIDDIHGWNFLGGKNGNVKDDTYELTREYIRLHKIFGNPKDEKVSKKNKSEYERYKKIKDKYEKLKAKNTEEYELYHTLYNNVVVSIDSLKAHIKTDKLTPELVRDFKTAEPVLLFSKGFLLNIFNNLGPGGSLDDFIAQLKEGVDYYGAIVNYGYNENYNSREIIGDNPDDPNERFYGNNDVTGPDAMHGTHCAGVIGADRTNDLGIKGIADHVKIMPVRALPPNGDERDKDVANAIRYAVDNGANIINMSFGKYYSPDKTVVDKAVAYAEEKGVLLVLAAGNESKNADREVHYPSRYYLNGKEAKNWVEVGASSSALNASMVADFSNYGKKSIDLFAPGVAIYSTQPGNAYKSEDGTSFSSPVTVGVAAMLMSYFPDLTAVQVRDIMTRSTRKFDNLKVQKPGGGSIQFDELSSSGGLLNAYEAVKLAQSAYRDPLVK